jgi:F0F1-type ATP synthase membrane subunit b/b'
MYGIVLHEIDGPPWVVYALVAFGLVLLALWKPGKSPQLGVLDNTQA